MNRFESYAVIAKQEPIKLFQLIFAHPVYLTYVTGRKNEEDSSHVTDFLRGNSKLNTKFGFRAQYLHIEYGKATKVSKG